MLLKKIFIALSLFAPLPSVVTAAPYMVFSGTGSITSLTTGSTQNVQTSSHLLLIVDLGDTSNYALLQVNSANGVGTITGYPIANVTVGQANANFFGGIVAQSRLSGGLAIFTAGSQVADMSNNTAVERLYGTGDLNTRILQIVPARRVTLVVHPRVNGVNGALVTFAPSAAINSATGTFPALLRGTQFGYTIAADGTLTNATTSGSFLLQESAPLTLLANIGGEYTASNNYYAVQPVTITTTITDALTTWLTTIGADNGYTTTVQ